MNWRCWIGWHKWHEIRLVEQHVGVVAMYLDGDVCKHCDKVKDPENFADVCAVMAKNPGHAIIFPQRQRGPQSDGSK